MKKTWILLTLFCVLAACKKNNVDFTYSPAEPRAGQSVSFTNNSDSGEDWAWSFGDGATSTLKSPSHVYKKPGNYTVVLKVDNKSAWTETKEITVYDTVPTFVCEDSVFRIYQDYTFTAQVYNPYNYDISYAWTVPDSLVSDNGSSVTCYFTRPETAEVKLRLTLNGEETDIVRSFEIQNRATNSVLLRTSAGDYRQRIFGERAEAARADASAAELLDAEQDTAQTYNGYTFTLSEIRSVFPGVQGFHIAHRKIYYRMDGLWVANIDGANQVQIDSEPCSAMITDTQDSRIYWANGKGVWYMPFIGSDNNKFVTAPVRLSDMTDVTKLAADYEPK